MLYILRSAQIIQQLLTIICTLFLLFVPSNAISSADDWVPDSLRVAILPLEPHSADNDTYGTYSLESVNGTASDHNHMHQRYHHYHRHHNRHYRNRYHPKRLSHDAAGEQAEIDDENDDDNLFCLMEENRAHWTPFGQWSECSDSCGGCGIRWRSRECRKSHIRCSCPPGSEKEEEACNLEVCIYPRKACCAGRTHTTINGKFGCERIDTDEKMAAE